MKENPPLGNFARRSCTHFCCFSTGGRVALPANTRAIATACHSNTRNVNPPAVYYTQIVSILTLSRNGDTYPSDKGERRIILFENMKIEAWHYSIDDRNRWKEGDTESIANAEDNRVYILYLTSIREKYNFLAAFR
jgi:hypothetical protein